MGSGDIWWTLVSGAAGIVVMACLAAWNTRKASGGFWKALVGVLGGGGPGEEEK